MIIKGPFTLTWGTVTLDDVEAIEYNYEINSDDYEANSGNVYQIDKSVKASARLTLLATDIASLGAVLPQHHIAEEGVLSDGTFVFDPNGAIDILADGCDEVVTYNDLIITSCGNPSEKMRLMHARTVIDSIEVGKIRKIVVKFVGEPDPGMSIIQIVGDEGEADFFQLDNDELFLLDDGSNLIL